MCFPQVGRTLRKSKVQAPMVEGRRSNVEGGRLAVLSLFRILSDPFRPPKMRILSDPRRTPAMRRKTYSSETSSLDTNAPRTEEQQAICTTKRRQYANLVDLIRS